MELSPRLQAIARQVPQGARLADVGTDHGYLPVWLLLNGRIGYAIAADLRKGPLDRAKGTARRFGQTDGISFRLCNGLTGIHEGEVDTVAIAGLGGGDHRRHFRSRFLDQEGQAAAVTAHDRRAQAPPVAPT